MYRSWTLQRPRFQTSTLDIPRYQELVVIQIKISGGGHYTDLDIRRWALHGLTFQEVHIHRHSYQEADMALTQISWAEHDIDPDIRDWRLHWPEKRTLHRPRYLMVYFALTQVSRYFLHQRVGHGVSQQLQVPGCDSLWRSVLGPARWCNCKESWSRLLLPEKIVEFRHWSSTGVW